MTRSICVVSDATARREETLTGLGAGGQLTTVAPRVQALGLYAPCPTCNRPSLVWHVSASNRSTLGCGSCGSDILAETR